jgi:hypothetical protein
MEIAHVYGVRNFRDHEITPAPPHCLLAGAALFMITKEKYPIRTLFLRDHGIVADDHPAGRGGAGCGQRSGTGTLPVTACLVYGRARARYRRGQIVRA